MISLAAHSIVFLIGVLACVVCAWGFIFPDKLTKLVMRVMGQDWVVYFAVVFRLLLGAALIVAAPVSKFPLVFEILGWIAIVAAGAIIFIGRERLDALVAWFVRRSAWFARLWLLFGMAFGGFLIYGITSGQLL